MRILKSNKTYLRKRKHKKAYNPENLKSSRKPRKIQAKSENQQKQTKKSPCKVRQCVTCGDGWTHHVKGSCALMRREVPRRSTPN